MFANKVELFEVKENEALFGEICQKLKDHPFDSPWTICFDSKKEKESDCEVQEINISINELKTDGLKCDAKLSNNEALASNNLQNEVDFDEEKFLPLKTSLLSIQDTSSCEEMASIDSLCTLTLPQVPQFCKYVEDAVLNEISVAVFLNSISNLKKPLSITITLALLNQIIYPKILSFKCSNYRNLSSSIMNFFMVYPKAVIDGILIPCLKIHSLEISLQEILLKVVKSNLSEEHIAYCIQNIANEASVTENTFLVLQTLIEKKAPYNSNLHNILAFRMENWSPLYSSNLKFTKVLTSILSIYGTEFTGQQLKIYSDIVKVNKTIMKRAAENILKKLIEP